MDDCVKKRITQSRGVTHGYLILKVLSKGIGDLTRWSALLTFDSIYLKISAVWQIWFLMIKYTV